MYITVGHQKPTGTVSLILTTYSYRPTDFLTQYFLTVVSGSGL